MQNFFESLGGGDFNWGLILRPLIYIALGFFIYKLLTGIMRLLLRADPAKVGEANYQRLNTFATLGSNILKYLISLVVILIILTLYGVDVSSIFAGLGIATAIVGLAFQDFAKDIIAGLSILSESQFQVGDLVEVDGFKGRVIFLGLKTTKIRNYRGKVKIVANRELSKIINHTQEDTLAQVEIQAAYKHDPAEVEKALNNVKRRLDGTIEDMTGEIKVVGIMGMDANGVTWRVTCKCKPYKHFATQRALRRAILEEFAKSKIEIPYNQVQVHKD